MLQIQASDLVLSFQFLAQPKTLSWFFQHKNAFNRYRRLRPKVDANIFDPALRHIRRSDASEKREENIRVQFWPNSPVDKFRVLACIG